MYYQAIFNKQIHMMYSTEYGLCAPEVLYSAIVMFVVGWMYVEGLITSTRTKKKQDLNNKSEA